MQRVMSWGRAHRASEGAPLRRDALNEQLSHGRGIYGNGRSYGDAALNAELGVLTTQKLRNFISLDREKGILHCEAGLTLRDINSVAAKYGWRLPVVPGTQFVTLGGAIACDIHGKNHHQKGSFGACLRRIALARSDHDSVIELNKPEDPLFRATVGGLGLTGCILSAELRLDKMLGNTVITEDIPFQNLTEFFELSGSSINFDHTVAWIDGTKRGNKARGIFSRANFSEEVLPEQKTRSFTVPKVFPLSAVRPSTMKPFNELYFRLKSRNEAPKIVSYNKFMFPLDSLYKWNNIYGPRGFYQYQVAVPTETSVQAITKILDIIASSNSGSFLSVLKTFGEHSPRGLLSFPMAGTTLAMDFPNHGTATFKLFQKLDEVVCAYGGRIYAAKDGLCTPESFKKGYGEIDQFLQHRDMGIQTDMSLRLELNKK